MAEIVESLTKLIEAFTELVEVFGNLGLFSTIAIISMIFMVFFYGIVRSLPRVIEGLNRRLEIKIGKEKQGGKSRTDIDKKS